MDNSKQFAKVNLSISSWKRSALDDKVILYNIEI